MKGVGRKSLRQFSFCCADWPASGCSRSSSCASTSVVPEPELALFGHLLFSDVARMDEEETDADKDSAETYCLLSIRMLDPPVHAVAAAPA